MLIGLISRVGSSRLPRKPLLDLGDNKCSLNRIIDSAEQAGLKNKTFVLTSYSSADDEISDFCKKLSVQCYRGDPDFVLKRLIDLAKKHPKEDYIIYLGSDCPLVDISLLASVFEKLVPQKNTNTNLITCYFPNTLPGGYEINIVSTRWLKNLNINNLHYSELEHCFNSLLLGKRRSSVQNIQSNIDLSWLNFALDTSNDLDYVRKLIKNGANNNLQSILKTIINNKELIEITKKRIFEKVSNSFLSSPGMHKAIKDKIIDDINKSFNYLEKNDFKNGIKSLKDTKITIQSFLSNDDIKQIYLNKEELFEDKELIYRLKIFEKEITNKGFSILM